MFIRCRRGQSCRKHTGWHGCTANRVSRCVAQDRQVAIVSRMLKALSKPVVTVYLSVKACCECCCWMFLAPDIDVALLQLGLFVYTTSTTSGGLSPINFL